MSRPWPDDPQAYMAAYLDAWNEGDLERVLDAYHAPAPIFSGGLVEASDTDSRRVYLGAYLDSTRGELAQGTRWECPSLEVKVLGSDAALLTARWVFRRTDGTALEDYPDSYLLVRAGGRWGFIADVIHTA
jgi:uncharacterized protein DUF4440